MKTTDHRHRLRRPVQIATLALFVAGGKPGWPLPTTSRAGETAGIPYAADLVGACLGALAVSVALLPALGILETCAFLVVLKVGSLALVMTMDGFIPSALKKPRHRSAE
jgi:hypothetical protein